MKNVIFALIFFFLFIHPLFAEDLVIRVGDTMKTKIPRFAKVIVTNGKNIQVAAVGNVLTVRAKSSGASRISYNGEVFEVIALLKEEFSEYRQFKEVMQPMLGLELEVKRPNLIVKGELLKAEDWEELINLNLQKLSLKFQARIHPEARSETKDMLLSYLEEHHVPKGDINLSSIPTISFPTTHYNQKVVKPMGIEVLSNLTSISTAPMVRTNIVIASVHRDKIQKLGIRWPSTYSAQIIPSPAPSLNADENSAVLRMLEFNGWGRVLASPTLLCRSGKEASFFAGGEIPIRLLGYRQKGVTWKNYGVLLKVKPLADYQGQMSIKIETEVSNIDESKKVDDIPAIIANRTSSHFDLTKSRTIALSGLITKDEGESREGIPFLSRVPILGNFFSSQDFRDHRSELVIFVTPKIVLPEETLDDSEF